MADGELDPSKERRALGMVTTWTSVATFSYYFNVFKGQLTV